MATHCSMLVWEITLTEEPLRLWSMGIAKNQTRLSMHAHFIQHFLESCLCYVNGGIAETYTKKKKRAVNGKFCEQHGSCQTTLLISLEKMSPTEGNRKFKLCLQITLDLGRQMVPKFKQAAFFFHPSLFLIMFQCSCTAISLHL